MSILQHPQQHDNKPADIPEPYAGIIDARMAADAAYFERHPDAHTWTRPATRGEFWPFDVPSGARVRVVQLAEGVRARQVLA